MSTSTPDHSNAFHWIEGLMPAPLSGLRLSLNSTALPEGNVAREQFQHFAGMAFTGVLDPNLQTQLQGYCDTGTFVSDQASPGHREVEAPQRSGRVLNLVLSRPPFLRWLEDVTACGPLREVAGRVVQTFPRPGDELRWHDDAIRNAGPMDDRRLAFVLNLGESLFEGGEFELRRKTGDMLLQHKHTTAASLLIFRVHKDLEHRVLPLISGGPRRVYTGWAMGAVPQ